MESKPQSRASTPTASLVGRILAKGGVSQAELARRAGLPRSVLNVYLHGHREPGSDALAKIAAAAGLELDLIDRTPPVDPKRAGKILVQVLELAEALPYRPKPELRYPVLADRIVAAQHS
jgi:transcriptional regulator with XRE-family HTH domain